MPLNRYVSEASGYMFYFLWNARGIRMRQYVAIHEWPYIPCLWSVTLSSLITRCLWLRSGSERSLSLPLFLSLPLSLFCFLCPMRFIALQEPQALLFSAWGALLNTCDIGSMCMWLCMSMYLYPCEGSQSYDFAEDNHLQLWFKQLESHSLLPTFHTLLFICVWEHWSLVTK